MKYLHWKQETITDFSESAVSAMYDRGFVFTRLGKGVMQQTRSCRVNLEKFSLSSENRRILKKVDNILLEVKGLPLVDYDFRLAKLAKDFYEEKFGSGVMSAQKAKEVLSDRENSNFNTLLTFNKEDKSLGFAICYQNTQVLHYSYPFYFLDDSPKDMGLGMMTLIVQYAKQNNMKYVYLGSLQRPSDTYKLQFDGIEWFDGKEWKTDLEEVKKILASDKIASNE